MPYLCTTSKKKCKIEQLKLTLNNPLDLEYFKKCNNKLYYCKDCDIIRQYPIPSLSQISSYYDRNYQAYTNSNNVILSFLSKIYFFFYKKHLNVNKIDNILDYGCGTAQILNYLSLDGYKNLYAFDYTRHNSLNKSIIFLNNHKEISSKKYDLIILNHVLEHVQNPHKLIYFLKSVLKENGMIVGQTPNYKDFTYRIFGKYWGPLHQPYHLNIFSKKTLYSLCKNLNLKVKIYQAFMPTGLSMSFENIVKKYFLIKTKGRILIYPLILIISCLLNLFIFLFNREGSIINFTIKKI